MRVVVTLLHQNVVSVDSIAPTSTLKIQPTHLLYSYSGGIAVLRKYSEGTEKPLTRCRDAEDVFRKADAVADLGTWGRRK